MSKFTRLTGGGNEKLITPDILDQAVELGLPNSPKLLTQFYRAVFQITGTYIDSQGEVDPPNIALFTKGKNGEPKPTSISGGDAALAAVGILLGMREPKALTIVPTNGNGQLISEPRVVNRPFIIRPEIDAPYLRGFQAVMSSAVDNLSPRINFALPTLAEMQDSAVSFEQKVLARNERTGSAILYGSLQGMKETFPELNFINHGPDSDVLLGLLAAQETDGGYVISKPSYDLDFTQY